MHPALRLITALSVSILSFAMAASAADTPLDRAKVLYRSAAYEPALTELDSVDMTTPLAVEALEYRVLCLLALERTGEAERAAEALVLTAPQRRVPPRAFPPRFLALVSETRARLLPGILSRTLAEAREQYRQSHVATSRVAFQAVLALSEDPALAEMPEVADIRVVAAGFLDLLRNPPVTTTADAPAVFVPPVVIRQPLPAWEAPDDRVAQGVLGTLRVAIGSDGSVTSATIEQRIDPRYDAVLVAAAREW